jgi:hypothetical protein
MLLLSVQWLKGMNRILLVLCLAGIITAACGDKEKVSMTGEEPVTVEDFIQFFPEIKLPFTIADTTLKKKTGDSALIAYNIFTQFIPDSIIKKEFGKVKPKIYRLGRVKEKARETYLFIKAISATKRVGYLITFGKKNQYLKSLPLVRNSDTYTNVYGSLDKKFQITTYREKHNKSGDVDFKRNVYIYNDASNEFTLILTEPNEEIIEDIINPIDTLSQKNKYTGDYVVNKKNFISFRDAKRMSDILFFTHFEKNKGECVGELKGTARFVSAKTARYKEMGNPCTLEFTFGSSSVTMKEVEGCGSYRDIKCFFDGTYPKKKSKTSKKTK